MGNLSTKLALHAALAKKPDEPLSIDSLLKTCYVWDLEAANLTSFRRNITVAEVAPKSPLSVGNFFTAYLECCKMSAQETLSLHPPVLSQTFWGLLTGNFLEKSQEALPTGSSGFLIALDPYFGSEARFIHATLTLMKILWMRKDGNLQDATMAEEFPLWLERAVELVAPLFENTTEGCDYKNVLEHLVIRNRTPEPAYYTEVLSHLDHAEKADNKGLGTLMCLLTWESSRLRNKATGGMGCTGCRLTRGVWHM